MFANLTLNQINYYLNKSQEIANLEKKHIELSNRAAVLGKLFTLGCADEDQLLSAHQPAQKIFFRVKEETQSLANQIKADITQKGANEALTQEEAALIARTIHPFHPGCQNIFINRIFYHTIPQQP